MSVGFFTVAVESGHPFGAILEQVFNLPPADRSIEVNEVPYRLEVLHKSQRYYEGEMVRLRADYHPGKYQMDAQGAKDLGLQANELLGEETAFIYDAELNVLALQRVQSGVSAGAFAGYFRRFLGETPESFGLLVVLSENQVQALQRIREYRSFEVEVAPVASEIFRGTTTLKDLAKIQSESNAASVTLKLGVGRDRKGALDPGFMSDLLGGLLRTVAEEGHGRNAVRRLKVGGNIGEHHLETEVIDLLAQRMVHIERFEWDDRYVPYDMRRSVLHRAYMLREPELRRICGHRGSP